MRGEGRESNIAILSVFSCRENGEIWAHLRLPRRVLLTIVVLIRNVARDVGHNNSGLVHGATMKLCNFSHAMLHRACKTMWHVASCMDVSRPIT